jgi:hypothetical protein
LEGYIAEYYLRKQYRSNTTGATIITFVEIYYIVEGGRTPSDDEIIRDKVEFKMELFLPFTLARAQNMEHIYEIEVKVCLCIWKEN